MTGDTPRRFALAEELPRRFSSGKVFRSSVSLLAVLAILSILFVILGDSGSRATASASTPSTGEILVKFKASASQRAIDALNRSMATQQVDAIPALGVRVLRVAPGQDAASVASHYAHNPLVEFAEVNALANTLDTIPNDPAYNPPLSDQWGLQKVQGPAAWDITTGSPSVVIAVVDGGAWGGHPDLAGKVLTGYNTFTGTSDASDDNGHGTWVTGVAAAATNNGVGMAGMSWLSPVIPVKVCDSTGSCPYSNVAKGMTWAADHGAKVINLSLGGEGSCPATLQSAVDYAWGKGLVIVAASGNSGATVYAPANCNNVVAVGATDSTDTRFSWSNYGPALDLVAPGTSLCPSLSGGYAWGSGTSFAAPFVSGAAALLMSRGASNSATVNALYAGADDLGAAGWDQYYGWGRLNVYKAILALSAPQTTPTPSPSPSATATPMPAGTASATPIPSPALDTEPPAVSITKPLQAQTLKGPTTLNATASDNVGVARVEFYIDGALYKTATNSPYSASWNTRKWANGAHTITAQAYDGAGNGASDSRTVTVSN